MNSIDDSDLIGRFKRGDPSAFEAIVRKYQDRVYNLCRYMLRDPEDARDAAQDVFLKSYRAMKDLKPDSSLYRWIYRIALTTCIDYRRKSRREAFRNEPLPEDLASGEHSPHRLYESKKITESVQTALQKLPEKLRAAIVLREIENLSYEEIAQVLNTSPGTVKSRISRAREQLRHLLKKNRA
ncbi:MAG: sigma-70 family RNA polymerase sigma factor [Deltaproteobacteria bacterium]